MAAHNGPPQHLITPAICHLRSKVSTYLAKKEIKSLQDETDYDYEQYLVPFQKSQKGCYFPLEMRKRHRGQLKRLLKRPPNEVDERTRCTALQYAASCGYVFTIRHLVAKGADINAISGDIVVHPSKAASRTVNGATALHLAAVYGHTTAITVLLEESADIYAQDHDRKDALYYAGIFEHHLAVRLLLQSGATYQLSDWCSPNMQLRKDTKSKGYTRVMKEFASFAISECSSLPMTDIELAARHGGIPRPNESEYWNRTSTQHEHNRNRQEYKADCESAWAQYQSTLHQIISRFDEPGSLSCLQTLLWICMPSDPNRQQRSFRLRPILNSALQKEVGVKAIQQIIYCVDLVDQFAAGSPGEWCPLQHVSYNSRSSNIEIVRLLIASGASVRHTGSWRAACEAGDTEAIRLFEEKKREADEADKRARASASWLDHDPDPS